MKPIDSKKYLYAFLITSVIFFTALYVSNYFGQKKIEEIRLIQNQIAADILSSEVQTSLLEQFSCRDVANTALSIELGALGEKLSYTEENRGSDDPEVLSLKHYYSLLQLKDYILMNKVQEKCGTKNEFIVYFYSKDCTECVKQGYILTKLRQDYPQLRVYSFDYNIDVSPVKTLISINKIEDRAPVLLIHDEPFYGYKTIEDLQKIIPQIAVWKKENDLRAKSTSTPTTTESTDN